MAQSDSLVDTSLRAFLSTYDAAPTVWVALSGGLDSSVMLHALCHAKWVVPQKIKVIYIDHGLHAESVKWQQQCQQQCQQWGLALYIERIESAPTPGESVEAWARSQRYQLFSQHLAQDDILLMAHHADDQIETLLLNILRGAGPRGLSGIPVMRSLGQGKIIRPLLTCPREAIRQYAQTHHLTWVEDPSNADIRFDRNFLRHEIVPLLKKRWPQLTKNAQQTTQHCKVEHRIVSQWTQQRLAQMTLQRDRLNIRLLQIYETDEQALIIRAWLMALQQQPPGRQWLTQLYDTVIGARADAAPVLKYGSGEMRRFRHHLYWLAKPMQPIALYHIKWDGKVPLYVPGWPQALTHDYLQRQGLDVSCIPWQHVSVRSRTGGEKCRPQGWHHLKALKICFQYFNIPPWQRDVMPLLYVEDQLIMVIGGWVCAYPQID